MIAAYRVRFVVFFFEIRSGKACERYAGKFVCRVERFVAYSLKFVRHEHVYDLRVVERAGGNSRRAVFNRVTAVGFKHRIAYEFVTAVFGYSVKHAVFHEHVRAYRNVFVELFNAIELFNVPIYSERCDFATVERVVAEVCEVFAERYFGYSRFGKGKAADRRCAAKFRFFKRSSHKRFIADSFDAAEVEFFKLPAVHKRRVADACKFFAVYRSQIRIRESVLADRYHVCKVQGFKSRAVECVIVDYLQSFGNSYLFKRGAACESKCGKRVFGISYNFVLIVGIEFASDLRFQLIGKRNVCEFFVIVERADTEFCYVRKISRGKLRCGACAFVFTARECVIADFDCF